MAATVLNAIISQIRTQLLELPSLTTPSAPVITNQGSAGAVAYSYKVVALNKDQTSIASAAGATATGNATLTSSNFNRITITAVVNALAYQIFRTVGGMTQGIIATLGAGALVLDDTGLTGDASVAPTAATGGAFWTDAELLNHVTNGAKDLWAAILDVYGDHYLTVDTTNVTYAAATSQLTGVPADCFRVNLIEPLDLSTAGTMRNTQFVPRKYNHPAFMSARAQSAFDPTTGGIICFDVSGVGSPNGAPTILTAPQVAATMALRFVYNPTLPALTLTSINPLPGEADMALISYGVAFARAKEREDRSPDPSWIAVYATEKQSILTRITPRQDMEPDMVDGLFDDYWT